MSHYLQYYEDQIGAGRGVKSVYSGANYQRGSGIGSFLGSIFRKVLPYVAKGAKAVGKEAVRTGLNVFNDVGNNGVQFKDSFNARVKESRDNLKRKAAKKLSDMMEGSGYNALARKRKHQSKKRRRAVRNASSSSSSFRKIKKKSIRKKSAGKRKSKKKNKKKKVLRTVADIFDPR